MRVDFHNHLVPGVDDGARTLEDALDGVARMAALGFEKIVTTPHFDGSLTLRPEDQAERLSQVDRAFAELHSAVATSHPGVWLARGHEVMLDVPDPDLSDTRLHLADSGFVLVEWPRLRIPPGTVEALRRLAGQGIRPVIAHPERYRGMAERFRLADIWRSEGAVLQVNYGSLVGRYGAEARALAVRLLERGWVDCLATDFHGRPHLELFVERAEEAFRDRGAEDQFVTLSSTNPGKIVSGTDPLPVEPLPPDRRLWSRLRNLLGAE